MYIIVNYILRDVHPVNIHEILLKLLMIKIRFIYLHSIDW